MKTKRLYKRILATVLLLLAFGVFVLLPFMLYNKPFMKVTLQDSEESVVLEIQNKIAEIKTLNSNDLINSEISVSSVNELNKVEYYCYSNNTKYQVRTMFDKDYNIVNSTIFNVDTAHSLMLIGVVFLDMIVSIVLIIISSIIYADSFR